MKLRNYILAGLGLCVFTLAAIAFLNPNFGRVLLRVPTIPGLMILVLAWNAYAAIRWTLPRTSEDAMILQLGVKWGLAIGCAWAVIAIVPINVFSPRDEFGAPLWFLGLFSVLLLPFASGAAGAIQTGKVRIGMRVGFWSGVVGGLAGFFIMMTVGMLAAFWRSGRFEGTLELAIYAMFFLGTILGAVAGPVGGWIGLRLYRTGEPPVTAYDA